MTSYGLQKQKRLVQVQIQQKRCIPPFQLASQSHKDHFPWKLLFDYDTSKTMSLNQLNSTQSRIGVAFYVAIIKRKPISGNGLYLLIERGQLILPGLLFNNTEVLVSHLLLLNM